MALGTKRALAQSLRSLLNKRTLDKITVKDIVEDCGVNRQTFYYHFHDVYDLLEWIFEDLLETMLAEQKEQVDWTSGMDDLVSKLLEEKRLVLNAYHSVSHEAVSQFIRKWLKPLIGQVVEQESAGMDVSREDKDFVADLFILGTTGFLTEWIEHQLAAGDLQYLEKIKLALDGSARTILMRFDRNAAAEERMSLRKD